MTQEAEEVVFTKGQPQTYERSTSIHHWQLRDLISPAVNEHEFYAVDRTHVYCFDSLTKQSKVAINCGWTPNSMTCKGHYIAAGGLHGELVVRDLSSSEDCFNDKVGSTVNNALHIATQREGDVRLFCCCNDSTIKVYKLPSMDIATVIRCPCPINYAALSPDGQHLVAVGDCNSTYLYQTTPTGYTQLTSFTAAADVGMCAAWSPHGTLLSSVHQDGTVAVWEQRTGRCVAAVGLASAARCVKFSPAPLDLLAVSEHEERVVLLDVRRWTSRHTLELAAAAAAPGAGGPRARALDVSGIAFTPSGQRLWVGLVRCCLAYDIDCLKRRTFSCLDIV